jgi:hypothetical protein
LRSSAFLAALSIAATTGAVNFTDGLNRRAQSPIR